ncbi:hypothetical protein [Halosegnis marinus]|uniref:Uncharacterized protein n=1 Tax=Halosegnis marinus TaxID=3034023 RepID=A0ABD5ZLH1_9EURY|nr:hypothetical protein [Halosegnis sp. DT85]
MAPDPDGRTLLVAGGVLAALLLVYSVVIAGQLALWFALVPPVAFLYLFWRLVRAHERLAAAMAGDADSPERGTGAGTETEQS